MTMGGCLPGSKYMFPYVCFYLKMGSVFLHVVVQTFIYFVKLQAWYE